MGIAACIVAAILAIQSDEEKAVASFKSYLAAVKSGDHEKAGDMMHPRSMGKVRERFVASLEKTPVAAQERYLKILGFKDLPALKEAAARAFFVSYLKNLKEFGESGKQVMGMLEGSVTTVVGTVKKDDKVYIIAESTFQVGSETHVAPVLQVAYLDGDTWKLAYRGETNIGK
jgi:hypothetical protein